MNRLVAAIRDLELQSTGKWFVLAAIVGFVSGLGAIAFQVLSQAVQHFVLEGLAGFHVGEAAAEYAFFGHGGGNFRPWMIIVVMGGGGLLSGLLVYTFAPEAEGHGTDAAIDSFHNKQGRIRWHVPIIKTLASAVTLGTGGSAGREGPIAQIGAGFGSFLAHWLKLSARDRRIMLSVGMAAGVGAIFRAPLAGALFAGEILYRDADLEADVIVPSAVSSAIAYCIYSFSLPPALRFVPLFGQDVQFEVTGLWEMLPYTALTFVLVAAGVIYIRTFYAVHALFAKLHGYPHIRPMIGALLAAFSGLALYYAMGSNVDALAVLGSGVWRSAEDVQLEYFTRHRTPPRSCLHQNAHHFFHDQFRRFRRRFWAVPRDWRLFGRGGRRPFSLVVALDSSPTAGICHCGDGGLLRRLCASAIFDDSHGFGDDRGLPAAAADNVGVHFVFSAGKPLDAVPQASANAARFSGTSR